MPVPFPPAALWDFSLRLYARRGVPDACLRLQARHGIDVNLLFCCLWRGMEGDRLTGGEIAALIARVRALHEKVVKPLRAARTALKSMLDGDPATGAALAALRTAVKASELDAEHIEQIVLATAFPQRPAPDAPPSAAKARENAESYCRVLGLRLSPADRADLDLIVTALDRPKRQQSHKLAADIRMAEERSRRGPLASGRRGA